MNRTTDDDKTCGNHCAWWRLPLLLAAVLAVLVAFRGGVRDDSAHSPAPSDTVAPDETGQTVSLTVNFGDGVVRQFERIAWSEGMTVADALVVIGRDRNGVAFAQQGDGAMALLTELGGKRNEGEGGRNWTYAVNGRRADRSFAVYVLQPGDRVLWTFAAAE